MEQKLFRDLPIAEELIRATEDMGFEAMTEIQSAAIPILLSGADIIGRSSTGTGKTCAFGIPVVLRAMEWKENGPCALILAPTRELAVQITGELRKLSKYVDGVSIATIYGGQPMDAQIRQLRIAKVVVGTPGRIMDHMRRRTLKLADVSIVVLDEADEMLNMGFLEDITTILSATPDKRQTVLFSATMPPSIMKITNEFQKNPQVIAVDKGQKTVSTITQHYYVVPQARKTDTLKLLLELQGPTRSLIFCNTKKMVDELVENLRESGYQCAGLHGDMKQSARNAVMADFKAGHCQILIATDVAARGIDVEDIEAVFNYDIPQENEFYIHRIGRTGRAGKTGTSYTIASGRGQIRQIKDIERFIGTKILEQPLPSVDWLVTRRVERFKEEIRNSITKAETHEWDHLVQELAESGISPEQTAAALIAQIAARDKKLAKLKDVRPLAVKERIETSHSGGRVWVKVTIGADDHIGPNFILGAIMEASALEKSAIGKIDIFDDYSLVELPEADAERIVEEMQNSKIKGKTVRFSLWKGETPSRDRGGSFVRKSSFKKAASSTQGKERRYGKGPDRKN